MREETTNADLARLIESIATNLAALGMKLGELDLRIGKLDMKVDVFKDDAERSFDELRASMRELQEGAFTKEEKEAVMAMVHDYDHSLESDVLGKERITLKRSEYDATALSIGFANRFEKSEPA